VVTDRSRGQLLLVGAIVIATVVLASVVLLNTVHSSPSISAEVDAESLENVERASGEIEANLGQLFLTTAATATADDRLPYVNTSAFETVVDAYETEYNGIVASDRAFVIDVDYLSNESQPGAVAYNRSVFADGAIDTSVNRTVVGSASGGSISVGTGPLFPVVSLTATGVDLGPGSPSGVSLVFDNTSQTDRLNVTDDVSFDDTDPNNGFDCGFGTIDDATVSVEFSAGTGTVTVTEPRNDSSSPHTCAVRDVGFADSYDEVRLEVDGNSVETLSYVLSAAGGDCDDADQATCVDGDGIDIDVNPSFDISFVDPSVTHESSFTLYEAEDG
jgi:hypothetical protein